MREDAVEGLLTRVPRCPHDRDRRHGSYYAYSARIMQQRRLGERWSGCYIARAVERVLVLNASYEPLNVCSVRRAHVLVWKGKAEVLESHGQPLRTSIVHLHATARHPARHVRPRASRRHQAHLAARAVRARRLEVRLLRDGGKPAHARPRRPTLAWGDIRVGERRHVVRAVQPPQGRPSPRGDEHDAAHASATADSGALHPACDRPRPRHVAALPPRPRDSGRGSGLRQR